MENKKHLLENILFYFLGFFFVSCFLLIAFFVASTNLSNGVKETINTRLKSGLVRLEDVDVRITMLNTTIVQDYEFNNLIYSDNDEGTFVSALKSLNGLYRSLCIIANDVSYMFTLFPNKDAFLSSSDVSTTFSSYYPKFMRVSYQGVEIEDSDSLYKVLYDAIKQGKKYLSLDYIVYISSNGIVRKSNPVVMLQSSSAFSFKANPQFISVFVVSEEDVANTLLGDTLAPISYIRITDKEDLSTILDTTSEDMNLSNFEIFTINSNYHYAVSVFVPDSYISGQLLSVIWILIGIISIGCISSIAIALFYAIKRYKGFNHIISAIEDGHEQGKLKGDFADIKQRIISLRSQGEAYREEVNELERQNQAIQFQNILIQGMKTEGDYALARRVVSFSSSGYMVVIIRAIKGNFQWYSSLDELIQKGIYEKAISIHSGSNDEIFILPAADENSRIEIENSLQSFFQYHKDTVLHAGVSLIGKDIEILPELYEQAERTVVSLYMYEGESIYLFYESKIRTSLLETFNLDSLSRLKNLILSSQEKEIKSMLTEFFEKFKASPIEAEERKKEIFYGLNNVYQGTFLSLGIHDIDIEKFHNDITMPQMKSLFMNLTTRLCEKISKTKKSHNEELLKRILNAIDTEYSNPSFSSYNLSCIIGINEKYLNTFFKEQMGMTLFLYVQTKRLEEAKRLLEETDYTNEQIVSETGFGSLNTLYRNFSKYFGVTPKAYKDGLGNKSN